MKKTIIYLLTITGLLVTSCDLDELPDGQLVLESAISDSKSAENALNGVYAQFASVGIDNLDNSEIAWASNNELLAGQLAGTVVDGSGIGVGLNVNDARNSYLTSDMWENNYKTISAANGVLEGVSNLSNDAFNGDRRAEILGEAKFLRAYAHFNILRYYGQYYDINSAYGALIREKQTTATTIVKPRSSVADSYDFILADLEDAIADCPDTNQKYYATSWAAKLLKARVLLYRGNGNDYEDARLLALDVIGGPYQLDDMQTLFQTNGLNSSEVILGLSAFPNQLTHQDYYINWSRGYAQYTATQEFMTTLQGDPRENWMLGVDGEGSTTVTKYGGDVLETCYAFRLTEAYLIAAETYTRAGNNMMGRTYLKDVLTKAGISDFTAVDAASDDDLLFEIYKEYAKNMSIEDGHAWFALQRCVPFNQVTTIRTGIGSMDQYIMPIPALELTRNGAFGPQNPGYQDQ